MIITIAELLLPNIFLSFNFVNNRRFTVILAITAIVECKQLGTLITEARKKRILDLTSR